MMLPEAAAHATNTYDGVPLGQILADERFALRRLQRTIVADSGVHQATLSAYERCRVTPTWPVFVRILTAMNRKAVISTEPVIAPLISSLDLRDAIEVVLALVIRDRRYRLEDAAAAHVLGRCDRVATLHVAFEADASELYELSERAVGRFRRVGTERGGDLVPQIRFQYRRGTVLLSLVPKIPSSVEIAFRGLTVHVAPIEEIDLPAA